MQDLIGKTLVAMPGIGDPRFSKAVVLICAHCDDYAMGLVLNKPMDDLTLPELLSQLDIEQDIRLPNDRVLDGGPVGTDRGFVVHSNDYYSDGTTMDVTQDLCMTATRDILVAVASGGAPERAALTLGYAGWGPGQLEHELVENAWIVAPTSEDLVFSQDHSEKWSGALASIGIDPSRLHAAGGRA